MTEHKPPMTDDRERVLEAALTKLLNEANAVAEMARPCVGNTNVECLLTRCAEAYAALAAAAMVGTREK